MTASCDLRETTEVGGARSSEIESFEEEVVARMHNVTLTSFILAAAFFAVPSYAATLGYTFNATVTKKTDAAYIVDEDSDVYYEYVQSNPDASHELPIFVEIIGAAFNDLSLGSTYLGYVSLTYDPADPDQITATLTCMIRAEVCPGELFSFNVDSSTGALDVSAYNIGGPDLSLDLSISPSGGSLSFSSEVLSPEGLEAGCGISPADACAGYQVEFALSNVQPIPIPGALGLLLSALAPLMIFTRRRSNLSTATV